MGWGRLYRGNRGKKDVTEGDIAAQERPVLAITMGDVAGIGPEVIAKALLSERIYGVCRPLVVGDSGIMREAMELVNSPLKLRPAKTDDIEGRPGTIDLLDLHNIDRGEVPPGRVSAASGRASVEYIFEAARLALEGSVKALVTAPISKEATKAAGHGEMGHLELLARYTHATEYATMLIAGPFRVVHLTTHHSLREACDLVIRERILARLELTHVSFMGWGLTKPRIGVAAINPHAGEGGLLGREEIEEIGPAVEEATGLGIDARGPFPADTVFNRAIDGEFDAVLAMYHDQGHIPIKVYNFHGSVSIALGLPLVRTSVDHGTAFDIAGKGIANPRSLEEAIIVAAGVAKGELLSGSPVSRPSN